MTKNSYPDPFTKVFFKAATGIVGSWHPGPSSKPISSATSSHRAMPSISLKNGHIFIDQAWGRRPQEKTEKLEDNVVKKLKGRFKKK